MTAVLAGTAYWFVVARLGGQAEPWDAPGFWTIAYPLGVAITAVLGAFCRRRAWVPGALFMLSQGVLVAASGLGAFWAVGAVFLLMLAVPGAAAAQVGHLLRRR